MLNLNNLEDPGRTAPPEDWTLDEEVKFLADWQAAKEEHEWKTAALIRECLKARRDTAIVLHHSHLQKLDRGELWEAITENLPAADLACGLVSAIDAEAAASWHSITGDAIDDLATRTAEYLANREVGR